jgi:putative transposase
VGRTRIFSKQRDFEAFEEVVAEAAAWRWSSLWHRQQGNTAGLVDDGPLALPRRWLQHVQEPQTEAELEALRRSVVRGCPFGEASWQQRTAKRLGLQSTMRPRGRPWPKQPE